MSIAEPRHPVRGRLARPLIARLERPSAGWAGVALEEFCLALLAVIVALERERRPRR